VSPAAARRVRRRAGGERFRRILHASDFSPASRRAFDAAVGLAKANGAALTLVHVLEPAIPWVEVDYASPRAYRLITSARAAAAKQLEALVRTAKRAGVHSTGRLVDGNPRDAIPRAAARMHADLVVVGTHGRTGLDKLLLGSVAERVVATARCPVLTVRGR
jgi:nucleotide-binding universal stress UspA family protein